MKCKVFSIGGKDYSLSEDEAELNRFLENVKVSRVLASLVGASDTWSVLLFYDESSKEKQRRDVDEIVLSSGEQEIYRALQAWRAERAREDNLAPFMIAHNASLKEMIRLRPQTTSDLLGIKGFGEKRADKYGHDLIAIIGGLYRLQEPATSD
ncbi:MAG: HRDC domain-containing protein [Dehalococcoidia bacterium]